jgi:hypothetical protein
MPAIELARLKIQAARLAEKFGEPEAFLRDLNELLGFYTNRTMRAAQIAQRLSVPTYSTPRPVLRQIERELVVFAEERPGEAITLVRVLWEADSLESRLLAAFLLGSLPPASAISALAILPAWLNQATDKQIRVALLTNALARLRREKPEEFFSILEDWLGSRQPTSQVWGMQALIPLLQDPQFENLPAAFRILRPAILAAGPATQLDLQACLAALEHVSLTETVAYLREIVRSDPQPMALRIFRRILPALSQELQEALRESLREQGGQASMD